jgi:hypothetical protein
MGVLTDDLTRLRNEVLALRSVRQGLMHDLEQETGDRRADVSRMLTDFSKDLDSVARRTKADRLGSISVLKRTVGDILTGVRTDLSGVRQAWLALGTPSPGAVEELEKRARLKAGAKAEGSRSETGRKRPLVRVRGEKPVRKRRKR